MSSMTKVYYRALKKINHSYEQVVAKNNDKVFNDK